MTDIRGGLRDTTGFQNGLMGSDGVATPLGDLTAAVERVGL